MARGLFHLVLRGRSRLFKLALSVLLPLLTVVSLRGLGPPQDSEAIEDITGQYHFLSADDTLALLEEDDKLKGYIDVYQNDEESDTVLSYAIISGGRKKDHVEFKTSKIHQKYFRFAGTVERGKGHEEKDPDYLRLTGDLEIAITKAGAADETVQRVHVVFKSMGKAEAAEE